MTLQELKEKAAALSVDERLELISAIAKSLRERPEQEAAEDIEWEFLERPSPPHPWKKQLYIKGRRLWVSTVWGGMIANGLTLEEAADNWDLPIAAIEEAIKYCETNQAILAQDAEEERRGLDKEGVLLEPVAVAG